MEVFGVKRWAGIWCDSALRRDSGASVNLGIAHVLTAQEGIGLLIPAPGRVSPNVFRRNPTVS